MLSSCLFWPSSVNICLITATYDSIVPYKHMHVYWFLRAGTIYAIHFMDKLLGLLLQTLVVCSYLWLSYNCKTIDWMQNMKIAFKILFWINNFKSFGIIHCQAGQKGFRCIFPSELMMDKKNNWFTFRTMSSLSF